MEEEAALKAKFESTEAAVVEIDKRIEEITVSVQNFLVTAASRRSSREEGDSYRETREVWQQCVGLARVRVQRQSFNCNLLPIFQVLKHMLSCEIL